MLIKHDNCLVAEYLQPIKGIANEFALVYTSIDEDNLISYTLDGLGLKFNKISAAIQTLETPIIF